MTGRDSIFAAVLALWLIVLIYETANLFINASPHPDSDAAMMMRLYAILGGCLGAALISWRIYRMPFLVRVEQRMCAWGTGIAQLTMVLYIVALPICIAFELAHVAPPEPVPEPHRPDVVPTASGPAGEGALNVVLPTCPQCDRTMPRDKKVCMFCGPAKARSEK